MNVTKLAIFAGVLALSVPQEAEAMFIYRWLVGGSGTAAAATGDGVRKADTPVALGAARATCDNFAKMPDVNEVIKFSAVLGENGFEVTDSKDNKVTIALNSLLSIFDGFKAVVGESAQASQICISAIVEMCSGEISVVDGKWVEVGEAAQRDFKCGDFLLGTKSLKALFLKFGFLVKDELSQELPKD